MSVSENFNRKFNKSMRGYNTEEVDAAIDSLLRYCDELEDANREFEVANNDLIDAKNALTRTVDELTSENTELEARLAEKSEKLRKVEEVYNGYREKFGEARDLVTKAKTSAAEIVSNAELKKARILREAEEEGRARLAELDAEIKERLTLIERLDISYNEFSEKIVGELSSMLHRIEDFNIMPIIPDEAYDALARVEAENMFTDASDFPDEDIISAPAPDITEEADEDETDQKNTSGNSTDDTDAQSQGDVSEIPKATYEPQKPDTPMGEMKNTLGKIAKKVSAKKSTPHL